MTTAVDIWIEGLRRIRESDEREKSSVMGFVRDRLAAFTEQRAPAQGVPRAQPNMGTWHPIQTEMSPEIPGVGMPFQLRPSSMTLERSPLASDPEFLGRFKNDKEKELELGNTLIRTWKENPSPQNLEHLYEHFSPTLLEGAIRTFSQRRLPEPAVRARVYNTFHAALEGYDLDKAAESGKTFHEYFRKQHLQGHKTIAGDEGTGMNRWADRYSSFGSVNWQRASKLNKYRIMQEQWELEHGKSATAAELAQRSGVKLRDMERIIKELRPDHLHSRNEKTDFLVDEAQVHEITWSKLRDSFSPKERSMLDAWTANLELPKDQQKQNSELAAEFGITPQQWSRLKGTWRERFAVEVQQQQRYL